MLPDVSGTLLTTGNMPNVLESTSFTGESIFHGGASFLDEDVVLGTRDAGAANKGAATLELNAVLQGSKPLHFEVMRLRAFRELMPASIPCASGVALQFVACFWLVLARSGRRPFLTSC